MPYYDNQWFEKLGKSIEVRVSIDDMSTSETLSTAITKPLLETTTGLPPSNSVTNFDENSTLGDFDEPIERLLDERQRKELDLALSTRSDTEDKDSNTTVDNLETLKSTEPSVRLGYIGLQDNPDAEEPPTIHCNIDSHPARILVDSGCGTYVLSEDFAHRMAIPWHYAKTSIPVELAVRQAARFSLTTKTKPVPIGIESLNGIRKSFYLAPLPSRYDAIVGIPFIREFNVQFTSNPESTVIINGKAILAEAVPPKNLEHIDIATISRAQLKKMTRLNQIEDFYVVTIASTNMKETNLENLESLTNEAVSSTPVKTLKTLDWIIKEFSDVFTNGLPPGPPPPRNIEHSIPLISNELPAPFKSIFRLSQAELAELRTQLEWLLENGKISPSTSPYGAPVLFAKKKDGGLRMCIDYRALNSQTIKNRYAIPRIDELFDRLHGAKVFSKIDLTSGYWQIAISTKDRQKTAFRTRYGHYEFNVMPFGLTNAPATFQTLMNDIFRDMLDVCVLVYLDDILVYSRNPEDHEKHLYQVLQRLREHKLYARPAKCVFNTDTIEYLGHLITPNGIKPNPALVEAIVRFPQPETLKSLQSFLGMANYYRRFVKNYSQRALPLTQALRNASNSRPIIWDNAMHAAFKDIKNALITAPCLRIPDSYGDFEVTTDASEDAKAVGCILSQNGHPVAFDSKKLDDHQVNYTTHDKEMCAIMHALTIWRPFLLGKPFKIYTDHRSLIHLKTQPHLNQRQIRWLERAADYDFEILYKPGKENVVADALSRIQISALSPLPTKSLYNEVIKGYKQEPFISLIQKVGENQGTTNRFKIDKDKLLYYRNDEYEPWRLCLPDIPYRKEIIHENHDLPISGHPGFIQTYSKIARLYYWPNMSKEIRQHVQECDACQRTKSSTQKPSGELQPMPISERPWKTIGIDLLGPVPESRNGHNMILVVVDLLTKMAHFIPTTDTVTSKQLADLFLQYIFRYHGLPDYIVSDRDPRFTARFWKNLTTALGVNLLMSTAAHPQTDGQSEATVKIVQKLIKPFCFQEQDWEELLPSLEFAYNDTKQSSTKETPFYLNYGYHPVGTYRHADTTTPHVDDYVHYLHRLQEAARDAIQDAQTVQERYANKHRKESPLIQQGDWVLLRRKKEQITKFSPIADGPFQVTKVGTNTVTLQFPPNTTAHSTVNISRVQLYFGPRPTILTAPPKDDAAHEYPVDRVMRKKIMDGKEYFYIHWKGYPAEDDSWEPRENLSPMTLSRWEKILNSNKATTTSDKPHRNKSQ